MNLNPILKNYWEQKPLVLIVWLAAFLRLISVFFAKGWGMQDDHFLVIEIAQSWLDGGNFNHWLPWTDGNEGPTGHTFLYAGFHFILFTVFKWLHISDPQFKMFLVRLIHAAFSLVVVVLGYRIVEKLDGKKSARISGLLLAAFWFMPWLSVRNLVEVVAIPFLFISTWMIVKSEARQKQVLVFLLAGFVAGIAFSIRYQTMIYAGGMGLALLFQKQIKYAFLFGLGYFLSVFVFQGLIDMFVWGYPFAEFIEYVKYNMEYRYGYIVGEWYNYLLLIFGILIPPISVFMLIGMFKNIKRNLLIFLPTIIFLIFHSYFPNKQERFILTIVPFVILLGIMGWREIMLKSKFLTKHPNIVKGAWIFFWVLNIVVLSAISTMYSKRARSEAMTYLHQYQDVKAILLENSNGHDVQIVPQFYLGQWVSKHEVTQATPIDQLPDFSNIQDEEPRFVLFFREQNLDQRVESLQKVFPELEYETTIEPGFVDNVMHWLNPHNKNEVIYIYRNTKFIPEKNE